MAEVKVLVEGYARQVKEGWKASSTVTFVRTNGKNVIVDPGCNREKLAASIRKEGLKIEDIDFVFLTHNHPDHVLLAGLFENAKIVDELYVYQGDVIAKHGGAIPGTDLEIIRTPGHMEEHCSLVAHGREGTYVIAGDVFWWLENEKQEVNISKPDNDPEHMDLKKLVASRKKVLEIADWIIPGHGKMFRAKKS